MLPTRRLFPLSRALHRSFTSTSQLCTQEQKQISPNAAQTSTPQRSPPAATSTSAAQPLSTPSTPSPSATGVSSKPAKETKITSSVPAGIELKGLNYIKSKTDPVALEDHEYPDWLWTLLTPKRGGSTAKKEVDARLYSKSANIRRKARKRARADGVEDESTAELPVYEQTVDLRTDEQAENERHSLTRAMRTKRRGSIKETNFLKAMG